ncbi:MAG TPA: substrate-binding domain-containing protein [Ruminococcus flavefaciens]|nr:substrate-binding domain-containing protein [Ruminococcus flavefaciens]
MDERGIPFGEGNVIYGNFWINTGEDLAVDYISGKRRIPQAVICANDYMAFGLLDKLFDNDITPPDDITVIGYEHIGERIYHSPRADYLPAYTLGYRRKSRRTHLFGDNGCSSPGHRYFGIYDMR